MLVHSAPTSLLRDHGRHPNLGVLASPRCVYGDDICEWPWAADNDAFGDAWDERRFVAMIDRIVGRSGCLFVVVPDVVGDHAATLDRFRYWVDFVRDAYHPVAFVGQDGATVDIVPWDDFDVLFIGGTTAWKLGEQAREIVVAAKQRRMWVHMGRVNTRRRLVYAKSIGCDSVDGTNFSMYRQTNLPWALRIAQGPTQLALSPAAAVSSGRQQTEETT